MKVSDSYTSIGLKYLKVLYEVYKMTNNSEKVDYLDVDTPIPGQNYVCIVDNFQYHLIPSLNDRYS